MITICSNENFSGPPRLRPFGLVLHHDGVWTHEGNLILNRKLRNKFDRSVRYLPGENKYVVEVGFFLGEIEVEEAAFFVRSLDLGSGKLKLSDGTDESLDPRSLCFSSIDGALLCQISRPQSEATVLARFDRTPHADLLLATEEMATGLQVLVRGSLVNMPNLIDRDL